LLSTIHTIWFSEYSGDGKNQNSVTELQMLATQEAKRRAYLRKADSALESDELLRNFGNFISRRNF
jgi:hypothetical protein